MQCNATICTAFAYGNRCDTPGADVELEPQTEAADWPVAHKSILIS